MKQMQDLRARADQGGTTVDVYTVATNPQLEKAGEGPTACIECQVGG